MKAIWTDEDYERDYPIFRKLKGCSYRHKRPDRIILSKQEFAEMLHDGRKLQYFQNVVLPAIRLDGELVIKV